MDHVTRATTCFRSTFNTHQCLESIFPLLIATGEYLSAHHWQASPRVLLKWCYTGPSTCNCVAAVQSQPLKGQAVICLKWQQPNFYLLAGGEKRNPPSSAPYLFWQQWRVELLPFPCICMLCCESVETASCLGQSGSATSWPFPASCHHDTKLQRNGPCAQGLSANPVKCPTAIYMAYLNKHGLYGSCRFSTISVGLLQLFLEHLLRCINTSARKTFIFITCRSHLLCAKGDRGSVSFFFFFFFFLSAGNNQVIVIVIFWTIVLPVTHAAIYLFGINASDPRLHLILHLQLVVGCPAGLTG